MSGCGFTGYRPKFKFITFKESTDELEKAGRSDIRLIQLVTDYINEKNGISSAAKDLFAPVIKATDDKNKKHDDLLKTQKDLTDKIDVKNTILETAITDSKNVNRELIEKISKQAEIQKEYADAVLKQVETKIDDKTKETLENISKTADEIKDDVMRVRTANVSEIQQVKERMVEQDEHLKDLRKELVSESSGTRATLSNHSSALEEIQEAIKNNFKELPHADISVAEPRPTTDAVDKPTPSPKTGDTEKVALNKIRNILKDKMKKLNGNFNARGNPTIEQMQRAESAIDRLIKDNKTESLKGKSLTKNQISEIYNAEYGKGSFDNIDVNTGSGLNRVKLLLASHQAGNSAGVNEFMDLLKKLLKQNEISKSDYDKFLEQWST